MKKEQKKKGFKKMKKFLKFFIEIFDLKMKGNGMVIEKMVKENEKK